MTTNQQALAWLKVAESDLLWGKDSLKAGHFPQACFIAQQVGEKAIKALAYSKGFSLIKGHSITILANKLEVNGDIVTIGQKLDLYYIAPRYPDALPDLGDPALFFTEKTAKEALELAETLLKKISNMININ